MHSILSMKKRKDAKRSQTRAKFLANLCLLCAFALISEFEGRSVLAAARYFLRAEAIEDNGQLAHARGDGLPATRSEERG